MIASFIDSITGVQLSVVLFLIVYTLVYGIRYHMLAVYALLSGRDLTNDWLGRALNFSAYTAIGFCLYWWV